MNDKIIADLAQRIYLNHKNALDIIFEHRPKSEREVWSKYTKSLITKPKSFELGVCSATVVRFWPKGKWNFDCIDAPKSGAFKGVPILYEASVSARNGFTMELVIGNILGDDRARLCRDVIEELGLSSPSKIAKNYPRAWRQGRIQLEETDDGNAKNEAKLKKRWEEFIKVEPKISAAVSLVLSHFPKK